VFLFVQIVFLGLFCFAGTSSGVKYKDALSYQDVTWLTSHNSFAYPGYGYYFKQQNLDIDARSCKTCIYSHKSLWSGFQSLRRAYKIESLNGHLNRLTDASMI